MTAALDADDARFVAEFLVDRNAAAACRRAGLSPRDARRMLANADIQSEIARRTLASATESAVDESDVRERLIRETDSAIAAARDTGNLTALATHIKQRAMLSGLAGVMSGDEPAEEVAPPVDTRDAARAVLALLQEATAATGITFKFARPGHVLIEVPEALAATAGGGPGFASIDEALSAPATNLAQTIRDAVAQAMQAAKPVVAHANRASPVSQARLKDNDNPELEHIDRINLPGGCSIAFVTVPDVANVDRRGRPITGPPESRWAVYGPDGDLKTHCLTREAAEERAAWFAQQFARKPNKGNPNG